MLAHLSSLPANPSSGGARGAARGGAGACRRRRFAPPPPAATRSPPSAPRSSVPAPDSGLGLWPPALSPSRPVPLQAWRRATAPQPLTAGGLAITNESLFALTCCSRNHCTLPTDAPSRCDCMLPTFFEYLREKTLCFHSVTQSKHPTMCRRLLRNTTPGRRPPAPWPGAGAALARRLTAPSSQWSLCPPNILSAQTNKCTHAPGSMPNLQCSGVKLRVVSGLLSAGICFCSSPSNIMEFRGRRF